MPNQQTFAFFVSYRHTKGKNADKFTRAFVEQLKKQVELYLPSVEVFFDKERLDAGDDLNKLAHSLCRSAAMVMIYNPLYFDLNHTWCAREYKGMQALEKTRSAHPGCQDRYIIPVILRGADSLPKEIKDCIFCEDFEHVVTEKQFENTECQQRIKALAKVIYDRYLALNNAGVFNTEACQCSTFSLPEDADINTWLQQVAPLKNQPRMPGH